VRNKTGHFYTAKIATGDRVLLTKVFFSIFLGDGGGKFLSSTLVYN